jgi:arylsulfatase A
VKTPDPLRRRDFLRLSAALAATAGFSHAEMPAQRPNIVFILADDLGWADLGCYGSRFHETPRLDALAKQGIRFTQAYAACPVCSPTRASIMTGQYPARIGITDFIGGKRSPEDSPLRPAPNLNALPLSLSTLPELLHGAGYTSAELGKWHLGGVESPPTAHGFDEDLGNEIGGGGAGYFAPKWWLRTAQPAAEGEYITDRITSEACKYIRGRQGKDQPFFLYLTHVAPHIPLQAKPELVAKFEEKKRAMGEGIGPQSNAIYAAVLASLDEGIGKVLDTLQETGLDENTIVVFVSDNGGLNVVEGANTPATDNAPLRGGKGYLYEGGIRVPLLVRWPGAAAGAVCDAPVCSTDFLPTLTAAAGIAREQLPTDIDGKPFNALVSDPASSSRDGDLFWHYPHFSNQGGRPGSAIRRGDWKLIEWHETGQAELYDLRNDPSETTEVSAVQPERAKELLAALHAWREAVGAKMPLPK